MDINQLAEILLEIRLASVRVSQDPSDANFNELIRKYNMLFLGENFNCINSLELAHSLKTVFNINIDIEDLNKTIPEICKLLKMKYEPLINVSDASKPNPPIACYSITL